MGNFRPGSDIDLAVDVEKSVSFRDFMGLQAAVADNPNMIYFVDTLRLDVIDNTDLLKHIEDLGVRIFFRD